MHEREGAIRSARELAESSRAKAQAAADEFEARTRAARAEVYRRWKTSGGRHSTSVVSSSPKRAEKSSGRWAKRRPASPRRPRPPARPSSATPTLSPPRLSSACSAGKRPEPVVMSLAPSRGTGYACEKARKLAVAAAVAFCLAASVPARAAQPEPSPAAAGEAQHEEAAHGGGIVDVIARLVNFGVLAGTLVYLLRSPIATYLASRHEQIRSDLVNAAEMKRSAATQIEEIDRQMKALPGELDALRAQGAGRDRRRGRADSRRRRRRTRPAARSGKARDRPAGQGRPSAISPRTPPSSRSASRPNASNARSPTTTGSGWSIDTSSSCTSDEQDRRHPLRPRAARRRASRRQADLERVERGARRVRRSLHHASRARKGAAQPGRARAAQARRGRRACRAGRLSPMVVEAARAARRARPSRAAARICSQRIASGCWIIGMSSARK